MFESPVLFLFWSFLIVLVLGSIALAGYLFYIKKLSLKEAIKRSVELEFLLVTLPRASGEEQLPPFAEMVATMEPVVSTIDSFYKKGFWPKTLGQKELIFEIATRQNEVFFYVGLPRSLSGLFERQIQAHYPESEIEPVLDYSILPSEGEIFYSAAELKLSKSFVFPIRTYKSLESDPLSGIVEALAKVGNRGTAVFQVVVRPLDQSWRQSVEEAAKKIQEDGKLDEPKAFLKAATRGAAGLARDVVKGAVSSGKGAGDQPKTESSRLNPLQESQLKLLEEKSAKIGSEANFRVVTTATSQTEAEIELNNILAAFAPFQLSGGNGFSVVKKDQKAIMTDYITRRFEPKSRMILNIEELVSVVHFPTKYMTTAAIRSVRARSLPPPTNLPEEGTLLGISLFQNRERSVKLMAEDRLRHLYMIGKTGVGKTVLFENMILQDVKEGRGVCYIDPNGDAIEFLLDRIPSDRLGDVILFNPSDIERPFGLNLLEYRADEERDFLVQEAIQIFYKLFDPGQTGIIGPQFEHWFRNAALTVMSLPEGGSLIDIPRLFIDKDFEQQAILHIKDPEVRAFWEKQMAQTSEYHKSEMLNYFTSKFGRFLTNDMMRNIIGQRQSSFDFRAVMDEQKILLINLSKGLIGEINAQLLGMIINSKLAMAAFSRQDVEESARLPFYLYVDEFQNFVSDVFATVLSEARKYRLSLNITNQYIAQLPEAIRDAVIGNAGTMIAFRIGASDAEFLQNEFQPLTVNDLVSIEKFQFYCKLLINNTPQKPFNVRGLPPSSGINSELKQRILEFSRIQYGRARKEVDEEIRERAKLGSLAAPGVAEGPINRT